MDMQEMLASLQVQTNRNNDEKRKREIRERGVKAMAEALGKEDR